MVRCGDSTVYITRCEPRYAPPGSPPAGHIEAAVTTLLDAVAARTGRGPFTEVGRGDLVVLKPNWVSHENPLGYGIESLVTHTSLIEAVATRIADAMGGVGTIVIADAPIQSCDFRRLVENAGLMPCIARLRSAFAGVRFEIEDWRLTTTEPARALFRSAIRTRSADSEHCIIDVGRRSFLEDLADRAHDFRVTCYPPSMMRRRHAPGKHQYLIARRALEADLFVNLGKLKTHAKAGLTGCLKNLIGINGHKEFLPHHVRGGPNERGDAYSKSTPLRRTFDRYYDFHFEHLASFPRPGITALSRVLSGFQWAAERLTDDVDFGSWPGNDTIWRTALDINHLLYFHAEPRPKRIFNLVDAIVIGAGDGPLKPRPAPGAMLLAGSNPAYVDAAAARILGYRVDGIPMVWKALNDPRSEFADMPLESAPVVFAQAGGPVLGTHADVPMLNVRKPKHWADAAGSLRRTPG